MSTDTWLTSLITATPQEGFELAITLSRRGVKYTQPDAGVLHKRARNMPTPPTPSPPLPRWLQRTFRRLLQPITIGATEMTPFEASQAFRPWENLMWKCIGKRKPRLPDPRISSAGR